MSTETETPNTDEDLSLDTPLDDDQDVTDAGEADDDGDTEASPEPTEDAEDEEFVIEIDGELPEDETPLVKQLRDEIRERNAKIAELQKSAAPAPIEVGSKPTLEGCDYDEEKFEQELSGWYDRKRQAEQQEQQQQQVAETRNREMQKRFTTYRAKAAALPVKDFEDAEKTVVSVLPDTPDRPLQQALLMYADDPAKVVYALAKHPTKLAALAAETDPIRFVLNIRELERNLKVNNRRKPPAPESGSILRSTTSIAGNRPDKKLEDLEKEALRTGDMDKYLQYKRQLKQKAA